MTSEQRRRPLRLALEVDGDGAHPAAWRSSGRPPGAALTPRGVREVVSAAEAAGFDLVTFADSPLPPNTGLDAAGRLDAVGRAAYNALLTDRIGLAPTSHATITEPFHVAAQLASLDHASHGRAAWVVGGASDPQSLATVGAAELDGPDGVRRELAQVIEAVRRLWDSWEDDAVVKDVATGRYLDPDKVHHVDFDGASFSVKGPLITPRPPQGQVVLLGGDELDVARQLDVVLVAGDLDTLRDRAALARAAGAPLVFAEVEVSLDEGVLGALDEHTRWEPGARLRQIGSPRELAHLLSQLASVVDGVRLHPAVLAVDLPVLAEQVLPALADLRRPPRPGDTLRSTLGLPRPANRHATV
ncbi:LLM class flavin-dependent oxidoreductase [Kutzneria sp. NPDC052558]|uniref:LLM class flavin-dependent oxidoreductase n=1 Tax=Kutzneria sp. NPDC052558 TaxID=3364121 RepID=UPI0037C597EB